MTQVDRAYEKTDLSAQDLVTDYYTSCRVNLALLAATGTCRSCGGGR